VEKETKQKPVRKSPYRLSMVPLDLVLLVRQITAWLTVTLRPEILRGFPLLVVQLANEMTIHEHSPPEERMALPL
jgi:hypothetical protein